MSEPRQRDTTQLVLDGIALWEPRIAMLASWGIKGFYAIRAAMESAEADEAVIAAMQPKWDQLEARFRLLSGE